MTKGQRIKILRENHNLGQTALAELIEVSKQTLYKYENDIVTNIPSDVIERLASALGVSPGYLMGWESSPTDSTGQKYYFDEETARIAQAVFEDPNLRMLFDASRDSRPEDLQMAADMLKRFKETNPDG